MANLDPSRQPATYADYLRWEEGRFEILDGVVFAMSPAPNRAHQRVQVELARQIANHLVGKSCELFTAPFDVRLSEIEEAADDEILTVVQPDLAVVCDPGKLDDQGCLGAPDWVVEVLSPATAGRDHVLKRELYERFGVREYWLIHPLDRLLTCYQRGANGRFGPATINEARGRTPVVIFPGLEIDWDLVFSRFPASL
jgi:Uma2 family endonuclease